MEAKPVKRKADPRYPTRLEVMADRELLEKHMPAAWKSCAEIAGAATILLAINGCLAQHPHSGNVKAIVAPIFNHGEGRAADGCEVVNPPVFLSEQDAMQVIGEELQKSGVILSDKNVNLPDVSIPQHEEKWIWGGIMKMNVQTGSPQPLVLQSLDPKKKVGVAVAHSMNYFDLGGARSGSITDYNFRQVAQEVRDRVAKDGRNIYFGAFYDPTTAPEEPGPQNKDYYSKLSNLNNELRTITDPAARKNKMDEIMTLHKQHLEPFKQESRRLLRMQVKDFIGWLKGQGVI
jgi:hypothetical protein